MERIFHLAKNFGGSLSDYTVWLLERSFKNHGHTCKSSERNAQKMADFYIKIRMFKPFFIQDCLVILTMNWPKRK